jgi:hypothetical protein
LRRNQWQTEKVKKASLTKTLDAANIHNINQDSIYSKLAGEIGREMRVSYGTASSFFPVPSISPNRMENRLDLRFKHRLRICHPPHIILGES